MRDMYTQLTRAHALVIREQKFYEKMMTMTRCTLIVTLIVSYISTVRCEVPSPWQCIDVDQSGSGSEELSPTSRCIPYREALDEVVFSGCVPFFPEDKCHFFNYGADLENTLQILSNLLKMQASSNYCRDAVMSYICNYVYPGCNTSLETPIGICSEECTELVQGECIETFRILEGATEFVDMLQLSAQCKNTLEFVNNFGFNYTTHHTECYNNLSGLIQQTTNNNSSAPLEVWVISVAVAGPSVLVVSTLLLCVILVCCCCRRTKVKRKKRRQPRSSLNLRSPIHYIRENNDYSNHRLQRFFSDEVSEVAQEHEDLPLFQLLSEDVTRLGNSSNLSQVLIPFKQLCFVEEIAQGAFGRVYKGLFAKSVDTHGRVEEGELAEVAIKTIKDIEVQDSYNNIRDFIEESALMHSFDHPHVLGLIGISLDDNGSPYLVLPFMENGDLRTFLKNKREIATKSTDTGYPEGLQYDMLVRICHEIAEGMEYLTLKKLVHRDLAARNCMVDANTSIKVADFGLTRNIYESDYYIKRLNTKIPIKWMSPESLHDRVSNEKTDVWAYGVTCWEVFSLGRIPYPTVTNHEMLEYLEQGKRMKQPALCSDEMYELMKRCWLQYPGDRPGFNDIVDMFHSYIIPETCTPTTGKARYKVHIKAGTNEESLLTSIVTELKYTEPNSFDLDKREGTLSENSRQQLSCMSCELPQDTYMSMGTSFYVKMNPIFEGVASPIGDVCGYPYENPETSANVVRGIPQTEAGLRTGKRQYTSSASLYGTSYY